MSISWEYVLYGNKFYLFIYLFIYFNWIFAASRPSFGVGYIESKLSLKRKEKLFDMNEHIVVHVVDDLWMNNAL